MVPYKQAIKRVVRSLYKEYESNYLSGSMQPWYGVDVERAAITLDIVYGRHNSATLINKELKRLGK